MAKVKTSTIIHQDQKLIDSSDEREDRDRTLTCSIGVMAYNEAANIGHLLRALSTQHLVRTVINEIIVVASGCTDNTAEIVRTYSQSDKRVRLLLEEKRSGKASAINIFLQVANADIFVLESGDTIPEADTIESLLRPFRNSDVGMAGARPVPVNQTDNFVGFLVNLYWRMHHEVASADPKLGEMIAFRNVFRHLPGDTAVDEASIEALITHAGFRIAYAGDAVVRNKGAETIRDFLRQRRRVAAGHRHLQATQEYRVSTTKWGNLMRLARQLMKEAVQNPKRIPWIISAVALELYGRLLGSYDYSIKKSNPFVWEIAESTKRLRNDSLSR
jgi:poly-beta-1,6-N-acetyl-D-glucosamine synthase